MGLAELIARTGNRALTGFTAPKLLWMRRHEPELYGRIAIDAAAEGLRAAAPVGEKAMDVADASGTLLFDVARRRWSDVGASRRSSWTRPGCRGRSSAPEPSGQRRTACRWPPGRATRRPGALGVGVDRPGPGLGRARHLRGGVRGARASSRPTRRRALHTFCHAVPGAWHAMGVMLSAAGSLRWLRDVAAPGESFATLVARGRALGARGRGPHLPAVPVGRAHAARRSGRARRLRRPVACATTAARWSAPCSRGWRTGCATGSTCWWTWAPHRRSVACPEAGRAATSGCGSWPRRWSCRWSARQWTRALPSGPRCSGAWPVASGRAWRRRWRRTVRPTGRGRAGGRVDRAVSRGSRALQGALSRVAKCEAAVAGTQRVCPRRSSPSCPSPCRATPSRAQWAPTPRTPRCSWWPLRSRAAATGSWTPPIRPSSGRSGAGGDRRADGGGGSGRGR